MKRTPLKRRTPLRAIRRPVRKPPRRLYGPGSDPAYLDLVRLLPCCAPLYPATRCSGPIEAHHAGKRGVGQKSRDDEAIPLCRSHHRQVTDHTGPFRGWSKQDRREWHDARIAETRRRLGRAA